MTCTVCGQTEITALRTKVSELEEELDHSKAKVALQVQQDYRDLVSDVFSFSSAVKTRFEDYRLVYTVYISMCVLVCVCVCVCVHVCVWMCVFMCLSVCVCV